MNICFTKEELNNLQALNVSFENGRLSFGYDLTSGVDYDFAISKSHTVPMPIPATNLDNIPWAEISRIGREGKARDMFALGAQKRDIMKNGFVAVWQIIGFDHDDLADSDGKASITWDMVSVYKEEWSMNDTDSNEGGWADSVMRKRCNGEFFDLLSDELQAVVRPVLKHTASGGFNNTVVTTTDKVWLKSEKEIFGRCIWSAPGEGSWYEYYQQEDVPYYKVDEDGDAVSTWERSPDYNNAGNFCIVIGIGNANYHDSRLSRRLAPALCT